MGGKEVQERWKEGRSWVVFWGNKGARKEGSGGKRVVCGWVCGDFGVVSGGQGNVFGDRPAEPAGLNAGHAGLPIAKNTVERHVHAPCSVVPAPCSLLPAPCSFLVLSAGRGGAHPSYDRRTQALAWACQIPV